MSNKDDSKDVEYWKKTAYEFFKNGNYLEALEAYETITRLEPKNATAWKGIATTFSLLDKPYEALESLNKALKINPADLEALEIKGLILEKLLEENEEELNRLKSGESV